MKVMVLGGRGFVGRRVVAQLQAQGGVQVLVASRHAGAGGVAVDSRDPAGMARALAGVNVVVNCVTGDGATIAEGAQVLVDACLVTGRPRIVHLSSMAVYGSQQGHITEDSPLQDDHGWYGHAKIEAEAHMQRYAQAGGEAVVLRPGVIIGPDSQPWVGRFVRWLKAGRLADLGELGDGPANLVDVDDVAQAVVRSMALALPASHAEVFNLAAPDSPRWNEYFLDLTLAVGCGPLQRWGARRLKAEVYLRGVPLKVLERLGSKFGLDTSGWAEGIPPSLMALWRQQIAVSAHKADHTLRIKWTSYRASLQKLVQQLKQL